MSTFIPTEELAKKVLEVVDQGLCNGLGKPIPGQMCVEAAVCYAMGLPHSDEPTCVSPALRALKIRLNDSNWSSKEARAKGMRRLAIAQLGSADVLNEQEFTKQVVEMTIRKVVPRALRCAAKLHPDRVHVEALLDAAKNCEESGTGDAAAAAADVAAAATRAAADVAAADAAYAAAYAATRAADVAAAAADVAAYAATRAAYADAAADVAAAAADVAAAATRATSYAAATTADHELEFFAEEVVKILIKMNAPGCQFLHLTEA